MKKLRLFPIAALVIAVLLSAFTEREPKKQGDDFYWYYTEEIPDYEGNPSYYVLLNGQNGSCTSTEGVRCVILAPEGDPGKPNLSGAVEISYKP